MVSVICRTAEHCIPHHFRSWKKPPCAAESVVHARCVEILFEYRVTPKQKSVLISNFSTVKDPLVCLCVGMRRILRRITMAHCVMYAIAQVSDLINCICRLWFCFISHASTLGKILNGIYPVSCYSWESVVDYRKKWSRGSKADRVSRWQILYVRRIKLRKFCSLPLYVCIWTCWGRKQVKWDYENSSIKVWEQASVYMSYFVFAEISVSVALSNTNKMHLPASLKLTYIQVVSK